MTPYIIHSTCKIVKFQDARNIHISLYVFFFNFFFTAQTCLVNEFVARGDMLRILRRGRCRRRDQPPYSPTPVDELLGFACDIAQGMRHITLLKVSDQSSIYMQSDLKALDTFGNCQRPVFSLLSLQLDLWIGHGIP